MAGALSQRPRAQGVATAVGKACLCAVGAPCRTQRPAEVQAQKAVLWGVAALFFPHQSHLSWSLLPPLPPFPELVSINTPP